MGTKYSTEIIIGYNATPPPDDATTGESNRLKWSNHKSKLGDPLKTAIESINTKLISHFDQAVEDVTSGYTVDASDYKKLINITGAGTVNLGDAATLGSGFITHVMNSHTASITVGRNTGTDTINGTAGDITLNPGESATFRVNEAEDGYQMTNTTANYFPSGTRMLFQQTAAPTGWLKETTNFNDHALRVVTGTVGSASGLTGFASRFAAGNVSAGTALNIGQMPAHNHGGGDHVHTQSGGNDNNNNGTEFGYHSQNEKNASTGASGTIINTEGSGETHNHTVAMDVNYVDVIIAARV